VNIQSATENYEAWMRKCTTIVESDLRAKHEQMREDPWYFMRGTFYRWIELWPEICPELLPAPKVLACGDVHVDSFGTWRDAEGRMCWGVDDFDEAYPLPYTNDLTRLATSVKLVSDCEQLSIKLKIACEAILEGYEECLKSGGHPIVLAEHETSLERLGIEAIKPPKDFWEKLRKLPTVTDKLPPNLKQTIERTLPPRLEYRLVRRQAGMGSRGQQRFVAIAEWQGGCIAREAKAMVPSACFWHGGVTASCKNYYQQAISNAIRSRDPFQEIHGNWLIRRLSPDSNPIDINNLPKQRDEEQLLYAMGCELANVHLGSRRSIKKVLKDLHKRKGKWLRSTAKQMAKAVERDWDQIRQ
jgi:hypothetical protein